MPLKYYKNIESEEVKRSLQPLDPKVWEELLFPPEVKFMEVINKATGQSRLRNQKEILKARARTHVRDVDAADQMTISTMNGMGVGGSRNLLNKKGEKRRQIDDI